MTETIKHITCGQMVERDEFGIITPGHEKNQCRPDSALHIKSDLSEDLRSSKAQLYGKKGTF